VACLNVSVAQTGKAVPGVCPIAGKDWDQPATDISIKAVKKAVFTITSMTAYSLGRLPAEFEQCRDSLKIIFTIQVSKQAVIRA